MGSLPNTGLVGKSEPVAAPALLTGSGGEAESAGTLALPAGGGEGVESSFDERESFPA